MLLSALTLAMVVQATQVPAEPPARLGPAVPAPGFSHTPMMPGQRSALECRARSIQARNNAIARGEPLNRMPMGIGQRAVIRMIDGCPVATPILARSPPRP